MSRTSPRPPHTSWTFPYLAVKNADIAVDFYQKAFQFEKVKAVAGDDSTTWHAELQYKDQTIMLGKQGVHGGTAKAPASSGVESPIQLYVYCDDVENFYKNAIAAGAVAVRAPEDTFWGDRMCNLKDPDGYIWCFATYLGNEKDW